MKIAWICHFSNIEIQTLLHSGIIRQEMAPWISQLAKQFENENSIELHIIAPDNHISGYKYLYLRNIHYHFYNSNIYIFGYDLLNIYNINIYINYFVNKLFINKIINKIKPNLIHLHGVECAYYSSSIFQFKNKYPIFITVQGFISKTVILKINRLLKYRIAVERKILGKFNHFGYRTITMGNHIRLFNPNAILHWHGYPIADITPIDIKKEYDIVFFARVCKDKGVEDLLKALVIIKQKMPDVKLCIIGERQPEFVNIAEDLRINGNIFWAGFLPSQSDVHLLASKARISVLPTYHEIISGTIIESMFLKLPVVAYAVGSIPEINDKEQYISLIPKGNVEALAEKVHYLLVNPGLLEVQAQKAYKRAQEMFDNSKIINDLLIAYKEVIEDFYRSN